MTDVQLIDLIAESQFLVDMAEVYEEEALAVTVDRPEAAADHYARALEYRTASVDVLDTKVPFGDKMVKARILITPELAEQAAAAWIDRLLSFGCAPTDEL